MTAHRGQVALYLLAVLVAICVLTMMNVGVFLAVRSRNHAMNAGDAAALAVAKGQGELLNRIGRLNVEHLRAAIRDDAERCEATSREALRLALLGPVELVEVGNRAARENGAKADGEMQEILRDHARDVRMYYATNPDVYPPSWEGAWQEYAQALEVAASSPAYAGADNIRFYHDSGGHLLLNRNFYNAIAGSIWCWFLYNTSDLLQSYGGFASWTPINTASSDLIRRRLVNSEVYSLGLCVATGSIVELLGGDADLVVHLAGCDKDELSRSNLVHDDTQVWMFYDTGDLWHRWNEIKQEYGFPAIGSVRPEYDVSGCGAVCRVRGECEWVAAAKPFGTVRNPEGELARACDLGGFVTAAFTDARLVPVDAVAGSSLATADPDWMRHLHDDLPVYLERGPLSVAAHDCWYCSQLVEFEHPTFRRRGARWLKYHSEECKRSYSSDGCIEGGAAYGH